MSSFFLADEEKPFVFISYSPKDRDIILDIITPLYEAGWKIWYDEGLTIGDRYDETLKEHIRNCSVFLLFVTNHSRESRYIRENEIPWAIEFDKPIIKCIFDKEIDCDFSKVSFIETVSPLEIKSVFERVNGLSKGKEREAKGISVVVNPADRLDVVDGDFAYCLYADDAAACARSILLEARNSGCTLYDAVINAEDEDKLQKVPA